MNSVASCVMTTKTSCPCLTSKLVSSADLYAAIDPVTPSTTDFVPGRMRTTFRTLALSRFLLQSFPQFLEIGRHDEHVGQSISDKWIATIANSSSALCVDIDQNILSASQIRYDRFTQGPVKVSVDLRMLKKISFLDPLAKICIGKKLIIFDVDFAGTRRSGRAGDRIKKIRGLTNPFHECGLARARWSRNHKENSVAAEFFTQDFGIARESSPVPPCRR